MPSLKHIHKYKRRVANKVTGYTVYRCMLDGCSSFIQDTLAVGNKTICWRCGEPFVLISTLLAKPHCDKCTRRKEKEVGYDIDTLTELLG